MEQTPIKRRLALALSVGALFALGAFGTSQIDGMIAMLEWVRTAGPLGWLAFAGVYLVATVLMVPASFQIGAAGFLLGPVWGFLGAWFGSTVTSLVSFLLARTVLRGAVAKRAVRNPSFHAVDSAIGEGGAYLVALLRLSPITPYNIVSYGLGLTKVSARDYLLGSFLGSIPSILLWSYIGSTVGSLTELLEGGSVSQLAPQLVIVTCTILASGLVARFAQQALKKALAAAPKAQKTVGALDPR